MSNIGRVGRPTKLTPEIQERIVELLKAGNYVETACAVVGIGRTTYYDWMKKAEESTRANKYTRFHDAVRQAKAWSEARLVAMINKHAEKIWQAAAWMLERKYPERWGRNRKVSKPAKEEPKFTKMSPEEKEIFKRVLDEFAKPRPPQSEDNG
jgi:transposase-like protein